MAKKKTIYLHIGTPKTGTTSIQEYLASNYEHLYKDGFLIPKTSRRHKTNHTLFTNYCINEKIIAEISIRNGIYTTKELKLFRRNFYKQLRTEIKQFPGEYVVISNEQCYGRLTTIKELRTIKKLLRGLSHEIKIIVYFREQSDMLCSLYSSRMKNGKTFLLEDLNNFKQNEIFDYNKKMKMWEKVFGIQNIIMRVFDGEKLYEKDIISDFCQAIELPRYPYVEFFLNVKLNAKQCEYLRLVNEFIPFFSNDRVNEKRVGLVDIVANTEIESPDISCLISRNYQDVFSGSNDEMTHRYFGETKELFDKKPLADYAQNQTSLLTKEDIIEMTKQIISKNKEQNEMLCKCLADIFEIKYDQNSPFGQTG